MMSRNKFNMEHKLAKWLVYFKGIFGIVEFVSGMGLLLVGRKSLNSVMLWLVDLEPFETHPKLMDSTTRFVAEQILGNLHTLIALYMIVHGLVAIAVVIALIHKKLWAFPAAGILMALFIVYQIYRLALTFSLVLLILTLIDIALMFFLRHEYNKVKIKLSI